MFSKILVALDQGDTCAALFEKALDLAKTTGSDLMLLSVLVPADDSSLTMPAYSGLGYYSMGFDDSIWDVYQERYREQESRGLNRLRSFTQQATEADIRTEFTQVAGSPGRAICQLAKTWQADLVMVGSHGRTGLSEALLGSVSNYVMHHAPCSVLVVHEPTPAEEVSETADLAASEG
ncbi:MAG: universal stress protein [Cyanobacteria bacterium P01_G01_bin.38]